VLFQSVYRHELETKVSQKPWKQEITKVSDWPRRQAVAEFRLCFGHGCLGTHLHRFGTRPDPCYMLIGDSHIKRCSEKISNLLDDSYNVTGITKPNANLETLTSPIDVKG